MAGRTGNLRIGGGCNNMIHLVDVTEENRLEIVALSVKDEQRQ